MQNNIDYREIVQTVTSNVLTEIKAQLSSMKSEIVDDLAEKVKSSLQPSFDALSSQLGGMQWRISELEQKSGSSNKKKTKQTTHTNEDISPELGVNTEACKLLLQIQDYVHIVHNGWIFYDGWGLIKDERCVYMIREDGTCNTDITGLFEFKDPKNGNDKDYITDFITVLENGSDWLIKYHTSYSNNRVTVIHMP